MSTHRRAADDTAPAPAAVAVLANAADDAPPPGGASAAAAQSEERGRRRTIRNAVVVGCLSMAGGSAGCAFSGPVFTIFGIIAVIAASVTGVAAAVALSAILGSRDHRSPFDRLMLILCVILGRLPGTYLPPAQDGQYANVPKPPAGN
jgi:hypothetical protein